MSCGHSVSPSLHDDAVASSPDDIAAALDHELAVLDQIPKSIGDNLGVFVDLRLIVRLGEPFCKCLVGDGRGVSLVWR